MVTTIKIKPVPILEPFVNCYALRVFNTGNLVLPQLLHSIHECYLTFFLKDQFCTVEDTSKRISRYSTSLVSFITQPSGCVYYKGNFSLFSVQLKVNGVFAIFGIPQKLLTNTIISADCVLGNDSSLLTEQLESCKTIFEMSRYMNIYLAKKLLQQKHNYYTNTLASVSNIIFENRGIVSVDSLSRYANMSFRNFERRFTEEVGMPPKLYVRITRFFNALENKMLYPYKKWTDIAYENGFFDQAHLIREVKAFSYKTPEELLTDSPPPKEFIEKVK